MRFNEPSALMETAHTLVVEPIARIWLVEHCNLQDDALAVAHHASNCCVGDQ